MVRYYLSTAAVNLVLRCIREVTIKSKASESHKKKCRNAEFQLFYCYDLALLFFQIIPLFLPHFSVLFHPSIYHIPQTAILAFLTTFNYIYLCIYPLLLYDLTSLTQ